MQWYSLRSKLILCVYSFLLVSLFLDLSFSPLSINVLAFSTPMFSSLSRKNRLSKTANSILEMKKEKTLLGDVHSLTYSSLMNANKGKGGRLYSTSSTSVEKKSEKNAMSFRNFSLPKLDFLFPNFPTVLSSTAGNGKTVEQIEILKDELILKAKSVNRGLLETDEDQIEINLLISKLEKLNPCANPLSDSRLTARWKLIYTSSEAILGRSRFDSFRPKDDIVQKIDASKGRARNEETLIPLSFLPSFKIRNSVDARLEIDLEENQRNETKNRVKVFFEQFNIGPYIKIKTENENYLDVTYLDDDMRISRGGKGNVFVLINDKSIPNWSITSYDEETIANN